VVHALCVRVINLLLYCYHRCILVASPAFNACQQQQTTEGQTEGKTDPADIYTKSIGYLMTLVSVLLSGFVTIYFEKVVKSKTEIITIWERNFQLCFYSIVFCMMMNIYTSAQHTANSETYVALSNWSLLTLVVAVLGAGNGLIVAATLKHADSILKVLAQAGAILISTALGYLFQKEPMDTFVVVGCLVSILSIMNYTFDSTLLPAQGKEEGGREHGDRSPLLPSRHDEQGSA
jgi:solute carrier family 35 (UDP-sugar transporter), member A1/2/3